MKKIELEVPIKVAENLEFKVKSNYNEPESLEEVINFGDDALRIFNTGLRQINRAKVRNENNYAPVAKKLVDIGVHKTIEESLNYLLKAKGMI